MTRERMIAWLLAIQSWSYLTPQPWWQDAISLFGIFVFALTWGAGE